MTQKKQKAEQKSETFMPFCVDLDGSQRVRVTNEHPVLKGSKFEDFGFWIEFEPLSRVQDASIISKHTKYQRGREFVDTAAVECERFAKQIKDWGGFVTRDGTPIECNYTNAYKFANHYPEFVNVLGVAMLDEKTNIPGMGESNEPEDDSTKNSSGSGNGD